MSSRGSGSAPSCISGLAYGGVSALKLALPFQGGLVRFQRTTQETRDAEVDDLHFARRS